MATGSGGSVKIQEPNGASGEWSGHQEGGREHPSEERKPSGGGEEEGEGSALRCGRVGAPFDEAGWVTVRGERDVPM